MRFTESDALWHREWNAWWDSSNHSHDTECVLPAPRQTFKIRARAMKNLMGFSNSVVKERRRGDNTKLSVHKRRFQGFPLCYNLKKILFASRDPARNWNGIKMGCFYLLNVNEANRKSLQASTCTWVASTLDEFTENIFELFAFFLAGALSFCLNNCRIS